MACTPPGDTPKRKATYQYTIDYSFVYEKDNEEGRINLSKSCKYWYNKVGDKLFGKSQIGSGSKTQCSRNFPLLKENDAVLYTISNQVMRYKILNSRGYIVLKDVGSETDSGISFYAEKDEKFKNWGRPYIRLETANYYDKQFRRKLEDFSQLKGATFIRAEVRLRKNVFEAPDWADTNTNKK